MQNAGQKTTQIHDRIALYLRYLVMRPMLANDLAAIAASEFFDADYYLAEYPDVADEGLDPVLHYLEYGAAEGRNPSALFDTTFYLRSNPDVAASGINPLLHFIKFGQAEKRPATGVLPQSVSGEITKVAVVGWDMGHNPVGRSFLIADMIRSSFEVELIGPLFKAYGDQVWEPLRGSALKIKSFQATQTSDFLMSAIDIASQVTCDAVIVCKARLPSIILGLLIKHKNGCPLIIDVDDHELSFFENREPLTIEQLRATLDTFAKEDLETPYGQTWSRVAETLIETMDSVIVSNSALRRKFGGTIVRHGRNARKFLADAGVRKFVRREFGFNDDDKVILFLGTPRPHKGVLRLAAALDRVKDPRLALAMIGTIRDKRTKTAFSKYPNARISFFPDQPWNRLQELITMADAVFLLQEPDNPISQYQSPAKLAEAMALSVPIVATKVEPLSDVPDHVIHRVDTDDDIDARLRALADGTLARLGEAQAQRDYFIEELSYLVNGARIRGVVADAKEKARTWHPAWTKLLQLLQSQFDIKLPAFVPEWAEAIAAPRPRLSPGGQFDVAFFWKQNDTGIYGRRHDMMIKYLAKHERVRHIVQFDAPISASKLEAMVSLDPFSQFSHDNLIYANTVERFLGLADRGKLHQRTFVYADRSGPRQFAGQPLQQLGAYPQFVKQTIAHLGSDLPLVAWVCPVILEFPALAKAIDFSLVLADLIDDQRTMPANAEHRQRLAASYRQTLGTADLVITNCDANQIAFQPERSDISVIPNAAEVFDLRSAAPRPPEFEALHGPIIGYVGNLRSRIDIDLISKLAAERPHWNIVLIGSAHGSPPPEIFKLRHLTNLHLLGVRAYDEIGPYIRNFDVAIMPHVSNEISERMNPLKLYVYFAYGVPIVTMDVPNIGEIAPYARIARSHGEFIAAVDAALAEGRTGPRSEHKSLIEAISWERRVADVIALLDKAHRQ